MSDVTVTDGLVAGIADRPFHWLRNVAHHMRSCQ